MTNPPEVLAAQSDSEPKDAHEVRQCQDQDSPAFGSVAVKSEVPGLTWGIFNPRNGGHWASDDEVKDWKRLTNAS